MLRLKNLIIVLSCFITTVNFSQENVTIQCDYSYRYMEKSRYNQIFNFSISDSIMVHNVMDDYYQVEQSQVYKIQEVVYNEDTLQNVLEYDVMVKSGKTGMLWYYEFTIDLETGNVNMYVDEKPIKKSSTTVNNYLGSAGILSPYKYDRSLKSYYESIKTEDIENFLYYVRLAQFSYHEDSALNMLNKALNDELYQDKDEAKIHAEMAVIYFIKEDYKEGLKNADKAIKNGDDNGFNYCVRGNIKIKLGKQKDACKDLKETIEKGFTWDDSFEEVYGLIEPEKLLIKHCNTN